MSETVFTATIAGVQDFGYHSPEGSRWTRLKSPTLKLATLNPTGARMRDIHKIDELPAVVEKIERDGGRLVSVSRFA